MRRWFHNRFNRHKWVTVSHRHDIQQRDETIDCYKLEDCLCGAIREQWIIGREIESPFPGVVMGFAEVHAHDLDRLEDAKVWAEK